MLSPTVASGRRHPWNKGKLVGQKAALELRDIWAIRVRLELANRMRDSALFNLAIDSKLRGCDLVQLRVRDVAHGDRIAARTIVMQQKTQRPVSVRNHGADPQIGVRLDSPRGIESGGLSVSEPNTTFPTSVDPAIRENCRGLGQRNRLGCRRYGTRSPSRSPWCSRRTKNLRAVQLLGHSKLESAVRYLGIEVDDALEMAEQTEV